MLRAIAARVTRVVRAPTELRLLAASPLSLFVPRTIAVSAATSLIAGSASALCAGDEHQVDNLPPVPSLLTSQIKTLGGEDDDDDLAGLNLDELEDEECTDIVTEDLPGIADALNIQGTEDVKAPAEGCGQNITQGPHEFDLCQDAQRPPWEWLPPLESQDIAATVLGTDNLNLKGTQGLTLLDNSFHGIPKQTTPKCHQSMMEQINKPQNVIPDVIPDPPFRNVTEMKKINVTSLMEFSGCGIGSRTGTSYVHIYKTISMAYLNYAYIMKDMKGKNPTPPSCSHLHGIKSIFTESNWQSDIKKGLCGVEGMFFDERPAKGHPVKGGKGFKAYVLRHLKKWCIESPHKQPQELFKILNDPDFDLAIDEIVKKFHTIATSQKPNPRKRKATNDSFNEIDIEEMLDILSDDNL